ncbi:hypothetical protein PanWU01x14_307980 [Parasponia andersonii]|uniref:Uncharacterized protein n=1 Tax=Parasponia andersonii TaxID=3476 RepID=A0A2P5AR71_PARAD|nr:hypothetical protein PanWU01x14_307980 [Parasponia andersonii]
MLASYNRLATKINHLLTTSSTNCVFLLISSIYHMVDAHILHCLKLTLQILEPLKPLGAALNDSHLLGHHIPSNMELHKLGTGTQLI